MMTDIPEKVRALSQKAAPILKTLARSRLGRPARRAGPSLHLICSFERGRK